MDNNTYKDMADEKIASFDKTYTSDHLRMLKIFLPYIPASYRRYMIIYIKFMELQHVFSTIRDYQIQCMKTSDETPDHTSLIQQLLPFCTSQEKQQFVNMENFLNNFEQMKNMMEMFEMMKDMFVDDEGGFHPEMFSGMMGGMDGLDFGKIFDKF